ncbi:MAG: hypothetical protein Kow00104_19410 [Rhodothalassiaceae bacterium]
MSIGFWQIALIVLLLILLFGRGKISDLMGDVAKGITSFKKGLKEDDTPKPEEKAEPEEEPKAIADRRTVKAGTAKTGDAARG